MGRATVEVETNRNRTDLRVELRGWFAERQAQDHVRRQARIACLAARQHIQDAIAATAAPVPAADPREQVARWFATH